MSARITATEAHAVAVIARKWPGMILELDREAKYMIDLVKTGNLIVRCYGRRDAFEYTVDADGNVKDKRGRTPRWLDDV